MPAGLRGVRKAITVQGLRTEYVEAGEGPPFVLLSSQLIRAEAYRPTVAALAARWRVFVIELPGSGRSDPLPTPWTPREYGPWTAHLLDALGLERPVLLGHSNSGATALALAAEHTDRLAGLVLADSIGALPHRSLARVIVSRGLDGLLEPVLSARAVWQISLNFARHTRNLLWQIRMAARTDGLADAARVRTPTLVAWGRYDLTMPPSCAHRFGEALPDGHVVIGPGSHDWLITRAAAFARTVDRFARGLAHPPR